MDLLKTILAALGGGSVVLLGFFTFFKSIIENYINRIIDTSAEKSIKKLENKFMRSMTAYEILLKKEFDYYESIDSIYADMIVSIQDVVGELKGNINEERDKRCENAKKTLLELLSFIPILKKNNLLYQSYIPKNIFSTNCNVVISLQDNSEILCEYLKLLCYNNETEINKDSLSSVEKEILFCIAEAERTISERLVALSQSDN